MQGSARRDTSARASALALTARTFIVCPCCENRGTLFWHMGEGGVTLLDDGRTQIRFCARSFRCLERVERARARDVQGGAAGPRSGRKRSGPRSSPVAAAATTP